jgi:hypothetical protein
VVYNEWTQFEDFPSFMKKVDEVVQESDEKLNWQLQIFEPRRSWGSTIMELVSDEKIVWRSKAAKGYVDGSMTFDVVTPTTTRVLLVLEYHARSPIEHIGALYRAHVRRARLESKHVRRPAMKELQLRASLELRHVRRPVMTELLLPSEDVAGDGGVIPDDEGVKDHERALRGAPERDESERRWGAGARRRRA